MQTKQGERFDTATDTEVIPKLCNYVYNNFTRSVTFSQACPGPASKRHSNSTTKSSGTASTRLFQHLQLLWLRG